MIVYLTIILSVLFLLLQEKNQKNQAQEALRPVLSASPMLTSLVTFLFSDKKVTS